MKRVIHNKVYDTSKAKEIGKSNVNGSVQTLFRKKTGEFFLYLPEEKPERCLCPLGYASAEQWAKVHLPDSDYAEIFFLEREKANERVQLNLYLPRWLSEELKREATDLGISISVLLTERLSEDFLERSQRWLR